MLNFRFFSLLSVLSLYLFAANAQINTPILMCEPLNYASCAIKPKAANGVRPSPSYTFADEVPFKKCDNNNDCFANDALLRHPFILAAKDQLEDLTAGVSPAKSPVAVLMVHGLSDGPYYNKALGAFLRDKFSAPVVAVRLSGHGSVKAVTKDNKVSLVAQPADLGLRDHQQWYRDMEYAYGVAKQLGQKVILAGFSMGAVLNVNLYQKKKNENIIAGMILMSPALDLNFGVKQFTCTVADFQTSIGNLYTTGEDFAGGGSFIRYMRMAYKGACNIQNIVAETQALAYASQVKVPVFTMMSTADSSIERGTVDNFMKNLSSAKRFFVINKKPGFFDIPEQMYRNTYTSQPYMQYNELASPLDHSWVMLDSNNVRDRQITQQLNPLFTTMSRSLCGFLKMNIPQMQNGACQ